MHLKKMGLAGLAALATVLGYVAMQNSHYEIQREIRIHANPEKVFPFLNSSRLADQWAPWPEFDPEAKMIFSGPDTGLGAKTSWDSHGRLGTGSATIVESQAPERVAIRLEYTKPFVSQQLAEYLVRADGEESIVTWKVAGENTFFSRLMCLFFNMDKAVGGMFEKGLAKLKIVVEAPSGNASPK